MVRCLGGTGEAWLGWGGVAGHQTQALTSPLIHHYSEARYRLVGWSEATIVDPVVGQQGGGDV